MSDTQQLLHVERAKKRRPLILAAVILSMFISAIQAIIVSTAIPSIVGELGGFSLFSWVFSSYLLMQAVTIPIYGKLADLFGRKPVFVIGMLIFLVGCLFAGFAQTMPMLIIARFIQGLGSGAIQPIASTIVGDIYTLEERGKIQGYLSSVWGISSVVGPALGGVIVTYVHWSWVFWLNIPFGIISIAGILLFLKESMEQKKQEIDYLGTSLLFVSISSLMLLLIQGGVAWLWISWPTLLLATLFFTTFYLFLKQEQRAVNPVMPLYLWKNKVIAIANTASLITGAVMIGVSSFLPTFVQGVMEKSPIVAGFTLSTMSIGWPIASTLAGRWLLRLGFFRISVIGCLCLMVGSVLFVSLKPEFGPLWAGTASFFIGLGMGFTSTTFLVSIQSSVDWQVRGAATASNMFMRILGNALGVALLGSILNSQMQRFLAKQEVVPLDMVDLDVSNTLLDESKRQALAPEVLHVLQEGLTFSMHTAYWILLLLSAIAFLVIISLPKELRKPAKT